MTEAEKWREYGRLLAEAFREGISRAFDPIRWRFGMTEAEAKRIIVDDPGGNIARRLEALEVAYYILGDDCTMEDIWRWAEGGLKK